MTGQRRSIGLSTDSQVLTLIQESPNIRQWILHALLSGWNGTVPKGPPTDQAKISLCLDDAGGNVPGTVLESKEFTMESMDPIIQDCEFDLKTELNLNTYYWATLERTGPMPDPRDPSYLANAITTEGDHPAEIALYYDGSEWWDISGLAYFILNGNNLFTGANRWTGVGGILGGEVFGSGTVVKIAQKFYSSLAKAPRLVRDTDNSSSGSYDDNNIGVEPIGSGNDYDILGNGIFYKWTAPSDGTVTVRTDEQGLDSDIPDTVLYILPNDTTITPETDAISWNDDGPSMGLFSQTSFSAVAGTTYYFLVKSYGTELSGTFKVLWTY